MTAFSDFDRAVAECRHQGARLAVVQPDISEEVFGISQSPVWLNAVKQRPGSAWTTVEGVEINWLGGLLGEPPDRPLCGAGPPGAQPEAHDCDELLTFCCAR